MPYFRASPWLRLALIGVAVASLGLAACGRKGPLDPPPGASLEGQPQANLPSLMSTNQPASTAGGQPADKTAIGPDGQPLPKGAKKRIPLDVLLN